MAGISMESGPQPPAASFFDSDDEESFVVLGTSLPPSPCEENASIIIGGKKQEVIDGSIVEETLNLVQTHLSHLSDSTASFPSMPKVTEQEMVSLADQLHLSTITTNSSVDLGPDEIQQKVDVLVEENIKLKEILRQNNLAMKYQYETLVLWQEDVMKVHQSHKEKFAETKKYIENLKLENTKLAQALALEQSNSNEMDSVEDSKSPTGLMNTNLTEFELEAAQKKILQLETVIKQLQTEKLNWEEKISMQKAITSQTENLQKELDQCKVIHGQQIADFTGELQQSESLQKILLEEIRMLKSRRVDHTNCIKQENLDKVQEQLMAAQMHITNLELQKNQDKEIINEKETKIMTLESQLHEDKERMNVLETQLELYKSDFETERLLKNNLIAEKDQIVSDLQQLQRRNNLLLEEMDRMRPSDFVHVSRYSEQAAAAHNIPTAPEDSPPLSSTYNCPLCMSKFRSLRLLEDHIEYCIINSQ